ncbi:MAG TPA: hypothetical protein VL285_21465 [Bryobacteraceae bacterium]|nr:hypothetical protein [Bryobacteraceae bacterium]
MLLPMAVTALSAQQRFYPDDPLEFEPPPHNVKDIKNRKLSDYYDLLTNQFRKVGERQPVNGPPIRAKAVNTLGEPMQGAWWVKRHYYKKMSIDELKRVPRPDELPSADAKWTVVSAKNEGVTPGFVIIDGNKRRFFIKFDPLTNPEMATSADAISSRFFYALGYHVPVNNPIYFDPDQLELGADVTLPGKDGKPRKMSRRDLLEILLKVPKGDDGRYRATASLALPGKPVGPPRYFGARSDDPNDIVPHEHRRDQRALHVIDAWLDHDDSRAINNLDIIFTEGGRSYLRHYQLDFGSTLGSGTQRPNSPRSGSYYFTWSSAARQFFSLGLAPPFWAFARFPHFPSIGNFEWKVFDPERWEPEYPNPAFLNRLPDDEFWGAKLVTAFTDEEIRAIVSTGRLTDKKAEDWVVECLSKRRDKIGRAYFPKLLPFDKFEVVNGEIAWEDLGAKLKYLPAAEVTLQWSSFDNASGAKTPVAGAASRKIPAMRSGYSCLTIQDKSKPSHTIDVFLRHEGAAARIAGLDRGW